LAHQSEPAGRFRGWRYDNLVAAIDQDELHRQMVWGWLVRSNQLGVEPDIDALEDQEVDLGEPTLAGHIAVPADTSEADRNPWTL